MAVPNLKHVVQAIRNSQTWDFSTKPGLCAYTHAVVLALHRADPNFVHLRKKVPKNGCYKPGATEGHAIDAALYLPEGRAVDFIGSAGVGQPNPVAWTLHGANEYGPADGIVPVDDNPEPPDPPDPPPMPPGDLEEMLARMISRIAALEAHATEVHHQIGLLNQQLADLDAAVVKKPLPPAGPHVHDVSLFGFKASVSGPK